MDQMLSASEKEFLLQEARFAIERALNGLPNPTPDLSKFSAILTQPGASFVTLTIKATGQLRGCIGTIEAYQPLFEDVREHAVAAALDDYRFNPVTRSELPNLRIEISRLTKPQKIIYDSPQALKHRITPGVDGVVIRDGTRRATFLPQVWEQIPDFEMFMTQLCYKMGVPGNSWQKKVFDVDIYQVEEFHE